MKGLQLMTGIVSDIDEQTVRVRVRLPACDNLRTAWLPVLQRNTQNNKDYGLPDLGEQVMLLLDADGDDGVVLGAVYSELDRPKMANRDKRRVDFADGTFVEYDRKNHTMAIGGEIQTLTLTTQANVLIQTQNATLKASKTLLLDAPDTVATGNLTVQKQLTLPGWHERLGRAWRGVAWRQSLTALSRPAAISRRARFLYKTINIVMGMTVSPPASRYKPWRKYSDERSNDSTQRLRLATRPARAG